jgi:hypothetical protein
MFVRGASSILLEHILGNVYEIISSYNIISLMAAIIISLMGGNLQLE